MNGWFVRAMTSVNQVFEVVIGSFIVGVFLVVAQSFFQISQLAGTVLVLSMLAAAVGIVVTLFRGR